MKVSIAHVNAALRALFRPSRAAIAITEGQGTASLPQRLYRAAQTAPRHVLDLAAMLDANANTLEAKAYSENTAPPAYRAKDEDGEDMSTGWPFGNAPVWSTGTRYYAQSLRLHMKTATGEDYSDMKDIHELAERARIIAINLILAG